MQLIKYNIINLSLIKKTIFIFELQKTEHGMTGRIIFDGDGRRTQFYLEILEMSREGFKKIAFWDANNGVQSTRDISEVYSQISQSLHNKTIIVASRVGMPFLGEKYK